ncbi:hypothetical protein GYA13_04640 [Candidatus Kuenenbacteria bacterium]|nr:hypothetical protein [Candidatus Kuenenbacteria bacterium]
MFEDQSGASNQPPKTFAPSGNNLSTAKTPPAAPAIQPSSAEPEDIFKNVDPAPPPSIPPASPITFMPPEPTVPSEPVIKSAPSIFSSAVTPKPVSAAVPNITELANPKTLDTKSIILLILIAVIIIGTVAAAIWWFVGHRQNKNDANNSPAVNLFNEINNRNEPVNNNTNVNANTNTNIDQNNLPNSQNTTTSTNLPATNPDTDGDGLTNEEEASLGTSPDSPDTDDDGLFDREEFKIYKTDPLKSDTDGDGLTDGEEVKDKKDPLKADVVVTDDFYQNSNHKFSFTLLPGMVKGEESDNLVIFNDDVNQIKFYIYLNSREPAELPAPDVRYLVSAGSNSFLFIRNQERLPDQTPYSTDLQTASYESANGKIYLLRYAATKRADNHQANFETLIRSFQLLP